MCCHDNQTFLIQLRRRVKVNLRKESGRGKLQPVEGHVLREEAHVPLFPPVSSLFCLRRLAFTPTYSTTLTGCQIIGNRNSCVFPLAGLVSSITLVTSGSNTGAPLSRLEPTVAAPHESRWKHQLLSVDFWKCWSVPRWGVGIWANKQSCLTNAAFSCLLSKQNGLTW